MEQQVKKITEKVLELMLNLDHPALQTLYKQWKQSSISKVELTGVGFYVYYKIPDDLYQINGKPSFTIQGVIAQMDKLKHGSGFVLFVEDGKIKMLECFTYEEPWPEKINNFTVSYTNGPEAIIKDVSSEIDKKRKRQE